MTANKSKKRGMTREQAAELYKDLQASMAKMLKNEADYYRSMGQDAPQSSAPPIKELRKQGFSLKTNGARTAGVNRGHLFALATLFVFAAGKVTLSALEYSGFAAVRKVEAAQPITRAPLASQLSGSFSREEVRILTSLDARRNELEERAKRLEEREQDIDRRDREFATRITQLKELNEKLDTEREKDQRKKNTQLEQLSNVYGSMNPEEAAKLIEQLDVTIALPLIERMPEKRIGQILASMTPERALTLTKLLSSKAGGN